MSTYHGPRRHADDPERRKWQDPEAVLAEIGLKPGFTFVDIGCGGGFFALPAARMVGEKGKVYGLDADALSINELRELAAKENLHNLNLTVGRAEGLELCQGCADIVFFGTVLHDFTNPDKVLANARKMIKPLGTLVDLDWKKERTPLGPPVEKRFCPEDAMVIIERAGFTMTTLKEAGPYHYLIIARPTL